ncbi:uncharacterized protein LOC120087950 [Benincasa hispida]|nr:uncharacterized protein LOC120087950 [Benincasa hispida]
MGAACGSGTMVAPGSGGAAHISREGFESNARGYFQDLHASQKGGK